MNSSTLQALNYVAVSLEEEGYIAADRQWKQELIISKENARSFPGIFCLLQGY